MMLDLDSNQVHLWLVFPDEIQDHALLQRYRELVSSPERMQAPRFHFPHDRHRYLLTRAAVRSVLSKYADVAPEEWQFAASSHGRPQIVNAHADATSLSFNISHTTGLIAIGVTRHNAVGVNVENMHSHPAPIDIADSYFAQEECSALRARPADLQSESFYRYWTLKESYIKARGLGLSIPLDQFSFHLPQDWPDEPLRFSTALPLGDDATRWRFWQLRVAGDFIAAICVARTLAGRQSLLTRKLIPLRGECDHECEWMAASA
jgi:4'-phosphopantetheinyl transferase